MDIEYLRQQALPGEKPVSWREPELDYCGRIDREREDGAPVSSCPGAPPAA